MNTSKDETKDSLGVVEGINPSMIESTARVPKANEAAIAIRRAIVQCWRKSKSPSGRSEKIEASSLFAIETGSSRTSTRRSPPLLSTTRKAEIGEATVSGITTSIGISVCSEVVNGLEVHYNRNG